MSGTTLNAAFLKYAPLLNTPAKAVTPLGQRAIIHNEINCQIGHIVVQILQAHYEVDFSKNVIEITTYQEEQGQYHLQMAPVKDRRTDEQWDQTLEKIVQFTKDIFSFLDQEAGKTIALNFDSSEKTVRYSYEPEVMADALEDMFLEKFLDHVGLKTRFNTIDLLLSRLGEDDARFFKMAKELH